MHPLFAALFLFILLAPFPASAISIPTVLVGNPGNANDPADGDINFPGIQNYGAVPYLYRIGTHEVTVGQYTAFLNAVADADPYFLYDQHMATDNQVEGISRSGAPGSYNYSVIGSADHPIGYVAWGSAARFCNWLHNGQPTGAQALSTTESGAYFLNGLGTSQFLGTVTRSAGATWFMPSENEWYKAAYYQPASQGGDTDDYWLYPTRTNIQPYSDQPPGSDSPMQSNTANFRLDDGLANGYNDGYAVTGSDSFAGGQNYLTDVGAYTAAASPSGAFDLGGNIYEMNDTPVVGGYKTARGGAWAWAPEFTSSNISYFGLDPRANNRDFGFRVATITGVPEPSTLALAAFGALGLLIAARRMYGQSLSPTRPHDTGERWVKLASAAGPGFLR